MPEQSVYSIRSVQSGSRCSPGWCYQVSHPNVGVFVESRVALPIYGYRLQRAGNDVLAALRKAHTCPLFPLRHRSGDGRRFRRGLEVFGTESPVDAEPGIKRRTVVSCPAHVPLDGDQRVEALEGGAHGSDEGMHAMMGSERTNGVQNLQA